MESRSVGGNNYDYVTSIIIIIVIFSIIDNCIEVCNISLIKLNNKQLDLVFNKISRYITKYYSFNT